MLKNLSISNFIESHVSVRGTTVTFHYYTQDYLGNYPFGAVIADLGTPNNERSTSPLDSHNGVGSNTEIKFNPNSNPDIPVIDPVTGMATSGSYLSIFWNC